MSATIRSRNSLIHFKDYAYERNISGAASVYREVADGVNRFLFPSKTKESITSVCFPNNLLPEGRPNLLLLSWYPLSLSA
jgi:hypothetical protein